MKKIIKILFSFDYELFMGSNSGSVQKCLIEPTNLILDILHQNKICSVFFIDASYLIRLEEMCKISECAAEDYKNIKNQICKVIDSGHFAYLHIHPHWKDAIYDQDTNTWDLSNKSFFSFEYISEIERKNIFNKSFEILNNIINQSKLKTPIKGFRAGGLYIQPFSIFLPFFKQYNIEYDFSVLPGSLSKMKNNSFDFSSYISTSYYKFANDVLNPVPDGEFIEFCISQLELKNLNKIINGIMYRILKRRKSFKPFGDGISSGNIISSNTNNKFYSKETVSVELLNNFKMKLVLKMLNKTDYLQFISHPKFISEYNLKIFDIFFKMINKKYEIESNHKYFFEK